MTEIEWIIPTKTVSEANSREHWTKKKKRNDIQKSWVRLFFNKHKPEIGLPCKITLTRLGKKLLDDDNLPVSMKYLRDAIADHIFPGQAPGRADGDKRLTWVYFQALSKKTGVKIQFTFKEKE